MKRALLIGLFFVGCQAGPQEKYLPNGCMVDAKSHQYSEQARQKLEGSTYFNEILGVSFADQKAGHAISIFEHQGDLWAYDWQRASWYLAPFRSYTAQQCAELIYPAWRIRSANWL